MTEIIHLYVRCVCLYVLLRLSGISEFAGNIINLGINTTLSRKLLTSKPDTKIGQTIVINSGQRSMVESHNLLGMVFTIHTTLSHKSSY
jgi:hypothetical protein